MFICPDAGAGGAQCDSFPGLTILTYCCQYGTLQFSKFEEIRKAGYTEGMKLLEQWAAEGKLPVTAVGMEDVHPKKKGRMLRRNSI